MRKSLRGLFTLHFLNDGIRTAFVVLLPFIAKDIAINYKHIGFLGSSQSLFSSLFAIPAGLIFARIGGFTLLSLLLLIYSIGALGTAFSVNVFTLTLAFFFAAIGFGMFHTVGFTLVGKTSDKSNIGRLMGDFTSMGEIGRVIIPPTAIFLTSFLGWRITMAALAAFGFLGFFFFLGREKKFHKKESHTDFLKMLGSLFKMKKVLLVGIVAVLDAIASNPIYLFLPFLLLAKGITSVQLGIFMGSFFVGSVAGKSLLGRATDKKGNIAVLITSELSMAAVIFLLIIFSNVLFLFLSAFFLGIFVKGTSPVVQTLFSELTHETHYNKIFAVSETFTSGASALSYITMGFVANSFGLVSVFYLCILFAIMTVIFILYLQKTQLKEKKVPISVAAFG